MAQTNKGKKKVFVREHEKADGTKVPQHYRSTPKTSDGEKGKSKNKVNDPSRDSGPGIKRNK